ncbi:MAG: pyridoxine 5'-phosphate synthase [Nitrospirae bacterium]|nr:pyridoxine 5'-phosphate synthase [Nitrospirota bacterium]
MTRRKLFVNVDHVATVRQARRAKYPDPVAAATLAELAGADGIIVHLREDRRHIQDRDLTLLRQTVQTELHMEMAAVNEMVRIALAAKPEFCVLVPERREELTTEGGLDVVGRHKTISGAVRKLNKGGRKVSLFIDPEKSQVEASKAAGAVMVELHTGEYCNAGGEAKRAKEWARLRDAARLAADSGLVVAAGHGLDYQNTQRVLEIPEIREFNIGFSIVARAVLVGFERAVREMVNILQGG